MKEKKITISFLEYEVGEELPAGEELLVSKATEAVSTAYAPYSRFNVGAAVLMENGEIICGSNQENTAYPSGLCAERVAIFTAKAKYPEMAIKSIAVTAHTDLFPIEEPLTPCGGCRQVIAETEMRQKSKIKILMKGESGPIMSVLGIESLLPLMFHEEKLKKSKL